MKFKIGDKVKLKDGLGTVYRVSDVGVYQCEIAKNGSCMGWYEEDDLVPATDPHKATEESAKAADISPYDEPYTLPWEHEYPRNDCNASSGYGAVIKGEKHETSDYERGLNEAWEIARKLVSTVADGGYPVAQIEEIFHTTDYWGIFNKYSAQKVVDKIKAWEKKQEDAEIKVGDEIVYKDGIKGVVVGKSKYHEEISVLNNAYDVPQSLHKNDVTKTGRHFDAIEEVLKQMQEEI